MIFVYVSGDEDVKGESKKNKNNESALARSLLDEGLYTHYGKRISDFTVVRDENGKPRFSESKIFFNISHSKGAAAAAIAECEVGVDIERIKPLSPALTARFLGSNECDPEKQVILWTEYESIGKCEGYGIPHRLDRDRYTVKHIKYGSYIVSVCVRKSDIDRESETIHFFTDCNKKELLISYKNGDKEQYK